VTPRHWLVLIVAAAALLRLVPVWFGLPFLLARPDEEAATSLARHMVATGDFNPRFFHWPSLTLYLFAGVYAVGTALVDEITFPVFFVICRTLVALTGAATTIVLYRIGSRIGGQPLGLIAAAALAVAMLHVRDSHFAMTDVLMTFFAWLSVACVIRGVDEGDTRAALAAAADRRRMPWMWFGCAGLCAGLAISTKYNAAAVAASMLVAQASIFARARWRILAPALWLPSIIYGTAAIAAFLAGTPYAVLDWPTFSTDLAFDFEHLSQGHAVDLGRGWSYHLTTSLPFGVGLTAYAAAVPGSVFLVRTRPHHAVIVGAFALALYASLASGSTVFFRYVLPVVPALCLAAAAAVVAAATWLERARAFAPARAYALVLVIVLGPGLINAIWFDALLARTDTRVLAQRWLALRLQPGDSLYDAGSRYTHIALDGLRVHRWEYDPRENVFAGVAGALPDWIVISESPVAAYAAPPPAIRDLVRREYELQTSIRATRRRPRSALYDLQDAFFMPVWGFWTVERPGPTVNVYYRRRTP
jgi:4-amino-4-deoxy-L-arabinose transferase-like glycosyltransferase